MGPLQHLYIVTGDTGSNSWVHISMELFLFLTIFLFTFFFKSDSHSNPTELLNSFMGVVWTFLTIFMFCEMGEHVTHQFKIFHEKIYQTNWYLFEIDIQRLLVIMLSGTQRSACIHGYAYTICTRKAFKKVLFKKISRIFWLFYFYLFFITSDRPVFISLFIFFFHFIDGSKRIHVFYDTSPNLKFLLNILGPATFLTMKWMKREIFMTVNCV